MVRSLGYNGHIVSFEPSAAAFALLEQAARHDRLWQLHRTCLADKDGTVEMHCFHETVLNSLHAPSDYTRSRFDVEIEPAAARRLPSAVSTSCCPRSVLDLAQHNAYLKIDTQGHDLEVVAADVLSRMDVVQTELSTLRLYQDSPRFEEAICLYREHGFTPVGLYPVNIDQNQVTVLEWDCIFTRASATHLAAG